MRTDSRPASRLRLGTSFDRAPSKCCRKLLRKLRAGMFSEYSVVPLLEETSWILAQVSHDWANDIVAALRSVCRLGPLLRTPRLFTNEPIVASSTPTHWSFKNASARVLASPEGTFSVTDWLPRS